MAQALKSVTNCSNSSPWHAVDRFRGPMNLTDDSFDASMTGVTKGPLRVDPGKNAVRARLQAARGLRHGRPWAFSVLALAALGSATPPSVGTARDSQYWIGTWATAPQPSIPGHPQIFQNQSLRLIVHISVGGTRVRIKISNTFGDEPLLIGGAHLARRTTAADIDPSSDRTLMFRGHPSTTIPKRRPSR